MLSGVRLFCLRASSAMSLSHCCRAFRPYGKPVLARTRLVRSKASWHCAVKAWLQADSCLEHVRAPGCYVLDLVEVVLVLEIWHKGAAQRRESDGCFARSDASATDCTEDYNKKAAHLFTAVCSVSMGVTDRPLQGLSQSYAEAPFDDDAEVVSNHDAVASLSELRAPHPLDCCVRSV